MVVFRIQFYEFEHRDLNNYHPNWDTEQFYPLKKLACALPAWSHPRPTCNSLATVALLSIVMLWLCLEQNVLEVTPTVCILLRLVPFI